MLLALDGGLRLDTGLVLPSALTLGLSATDAGVSGGTAVLTSRRRRR